MEAIPALLLWDSVCEVYADPSRRKSRPGQPVPKSRPVFDVDYVPPSAPAPYGHAKMVLLEDNDAVIKMVIKGRAPALRLVARTHRVNLDWLFERIRYFIWLYG